MKPHIISRLTSNQISAWVWVCFLWAATIVVYLFLNAETSEHCLTTSNYTPVLLCILPIACNLKPVISTTACNCNIDPPFASSTPIIELVMWLNVVPWSCQIICSKILVGKGVCDLMWFLYHIILIHKLTLF